MIFLDTALPDPLILQGALWQDSLLVQERRAGCWNVSCHRHAVHCRAFLWSLTTSFAPSSGHVESTLRPLTIHPALAGPQHGSSFAGFSNFDILATIGFLAEVAEDSMEAISCSQRSCWEAETSAEYISTDVCIDPTCIRTTSTRRILETRGAFGRLPWGSSVGSCWRQSRETWLLGKGGGCFAVPRCHSCVGSHRRAFRMDLLGEWRGPSCGS